MMCDWTRSDHAFTISVQEPDLPSLAGHVLANAQQGAVKHIMLMYQHALLVVDASTEQINVMWCMQELLSLFPNVHTDPELGSAYIATALRNTVTLSDEQ